MKIRIHTVAVHEALSVRLQKRDNKYQKYSQSDAYDFIFQVLWVDTVWWLDDYLSYDL